MTNGIQRIWFDCSHTMCNGYRSGVQRTVRKLLDAALADVSNGESVNAVIAEGDEFFLAESTISYQMGLVRQNALGRMPAFYPSMAKRLCLKLKHPKLRKWLLPEPGHLGVVKPYAVAFKKYLQLRAKLDANKRAKLVQPGSGDLLLLPDSYWERPRVWGALRNVRQRGARVATIIYDLIPLRHQDFVPADAVEKFRNYLDQMIELSNSLVCISQTVQEDLSEYIQQYHRDRIGSLHTDVFSLGCEMKPVASATATHPMTSLFNSKHPTYLVVATFDAHKNHQCVLSAFEELWQTHPNVQLCCVGSRGSQSKSILARFENHPRYQKQLFKFHDVDDASLAYGYGRAAGVICPSFVEGFGLPIVESLHHGRRTLASDTPIHREIGGKDCEFFAPDQPQQLAALLRASPTTNIAKRDRSLTTWKESWEQLLAAATRNLNADKLGLSDAA